MDEYLKAAIDNKLKEAHAHTYFHIPIFTESKDGKSNHWTLLVNDCNNGWKHYNSLAPKGRAKDYKYLPDARKMINYMEEKMNPPKFILDSPKTLNLKSEQHCPRQTSKDDCGVYICFIMNKLSNNEEVPRTLTEEEADHFRAEMVRVFLTSERSWTHADYMIRKNLEQYKD